MKIVSCKAASREMARNPLVASATSVPEFKVQARRAAHGELNCKSPVSRKPYQVTYPKLTSDLGRPIRAAIVDDQSFNRRESFEAWG